MYKKLPRCRGGLSLPTLRLVDADINVVRRLTLTLVILGDIVRASLQDIQFNFYV